MGIEWHVSNRARRVAIAAPVTLTCEPTSHGRGKKTQYIGLRLSRAVMEDAGWKTGDRVKVGMDWENSRLCVRKVVDSEPGAYKLIAVSCDKGKSYADMHGLHVAAKFRFDNERFRLHIFRNGSDAVKPPFSVMGDTITIEV